MKSIILFILIALPFLSVGQNVYVKGKTESYFTKKKVKDVQIKTYLGDSLMGEYNSNGKFKVPIRVRGIVKVLFIKEGYIDKFFLINTKDIPGYYIDQKYTIKADVSIILKDKYMEDNTMANAVAYAYFNRKYKGFIWDPEYTKKAQIAMDVKVFPLEEVVQLDSSLNPKGKKFFFQNGMNYYVNIDLGPQHLFKEDLNIHTASKIKYPVIRGYLYGKYQYHLIQDELDSVNNVFRKMIPGVVGHSDLASAYKKCKHLDTLILDNTYSAVGYWLNLVNYASDKDILGYSRIAVKIAEIEKKIGSVLLTDAELSFYTDVKNASTAAVQLNQLVGSLTDKEKTDTTNYQKALDTFYEKVRILSKNCEISK